MPDIEMTTDKTVKPQEKRKQTRFAEVLYDPYEWVPRLCAELKKGGSLNEVCKSVTGAPSPSTVMEWLKKHSDLLDMYSEARHMGYMAQSENLQKLAAETHVYGLVPVYDPETRLPMYDENNEPVVRKALMPLSSEVIASKKLQIETNKWLLEKMVPRIFGSRNTVVQENASKDALTSGLDLKKLNDKELEQFQALMAKASLPRSEE